MSKVYTRSFNGGIVSPEMYGRIDDVKNNTGLAVCRNFYVLPQGPVVNRPGTQFVREVKTSAKQTRLIPFRYSATQTIVIEVGEAYFRFHTFGGTLLTPTTGVSAWNIATAYTPGDLVTAGGSTWYAVAGSTGSDPTVGANQYGATPVISATWVQDVGPVSTPPSGYENSGSTLPAQAVIGQKLYISEITYTYPDPIQFQQGGQYFTEWLYVDLEPIETIVYYGYTGTAVSSPTGQWFQMPTVYEIPSPYAEADIHDLHYIQSGDIVTIVHPNYAPRELRRLGATKYVLSTITFGSTLAAPTISGVTPTTASTPSDTQTYSYVATRVTDDQLDESVASAPVTATNQLFDTGAFNTINFATSARRNVYRESGGLYGFIGQSTGTTLVDDNIAPDTSRTPPLNQNPFASDFPGAVCYYEQRRVFAGTPNLPQTFWMTKAGTEANLDYSIPVKDDDAISIKIAAREANSIQHAVVIGDLLLLTESAEWRVGSSGDLLTPTTVTIRPQSYIGASNVQPVTANTVAIYAAARGGHVRAIGFDNDIQSYISVDLSLRAAHLFDYKTIKDLAYAKGPIPVVWAVSSDGRLLGMTYVPEQQVYAWHYHDTQDGAFESVAVVSEGNDDILYAIVRRAVLNHGSGYTSAPTIAFSGGGGSGAAATVTVTNGVVTGFTITNGGSGYTSAPTIAFSGGGGSGAAAVATVTNGVVTAITLTTTQKRYVERLSSRYFQDLKNFFGADCGLTYSGSPAAVITGLSHLEGRTVAILADGAVMTPRPVVGGQITLDKAASLVHVGLPIVSDLQTLPLATEAEAYSQATKKNVSRVMLRVYRSSGIFVGPTTTELKEAKIRTTEPYGSPPNLYTGEVEVEIPPAWTEDGQIIVRQVDPVPLTIVSMTTTLAFGG